MEIKMMFDSLDRFYEECDILESTGDPEEFKTRTNEVIENWVGLSKDKILQHKYSYKEGLDGLKALELPIALSGSAHKYKFDENDGDDMVYDRFIEGLPSLKKRVRKHGNKTGKIINLHVGIAENCGVGSKEMMHKAYTAMRIIDYLENEGYRVGLFVYDDTRYPGRYKGQEVKTMKITVQIKKPEDPLIRPLMLTCISSWMFRYWFLKIQSAKLMPNPGYGRAYDPGYTDTLSDIYIPHGTCLSEISAKNKIEKIFKLFDEDN